MSKDTKFTIKDLSEYNLTAYTLISPYTNYGSGSSTGKVGSWLNKIEGPSSDIVASSTFTSSFHSSFVDPWKKSK